MTTGTDDAPAPTDTERVTDDARRILATLPPDPPAVIAQRVTDLLAALGPADEDTARCAVCRGTFIATPNGRESHLIVFGHRPEGDT